MNPDLFQLLKISICYLIISFHILVNYILAIKLDEGSHLK
jgi:hypothetical protein